MPSLPYRPALVPHDGRSSSISLPSSDSFYSNEDIKILHDVVATAQDNLDVLPERERLATNALFRAYDSVLPLYGIDPEQDHHISRLVFRVGGERGDGTLVEKFRAVLSRMGIELEFDNRTVSSKASSDDDSHAFRAIPEQKLPDRLSHRYNETTTSNVSSDDRLVARDRSRSVSTTDAADEHRQLVVPAGIKEEVEYYQHLDGQHGDADDISPALSASAEGDTEHSHHSPHSGIGSFGYHGASDTTVQTFDQQNLQDPNFVSPEAFESVLKAAKALNATSIPPRGRLGESHAHFVRRERQPRIIRPATDLQDQSGNLHQEVDEAESTQTDPWHHRLEKRAARTWSLYLLTKGLSHWAACATEKAEQIAVARRHILRIRHFDSWEVIALEARTAAQRLLASRIIGLWSKHVHTYQTQERNAVRSGDQSLAENVLRRWHGVYQKGTIAVDHFQCRNPPSFRQWQSQCLVVQESTANAKRFHKNHVVSAAVSRWSRSLVSLEQRVASFNRFRVLREALMQWKVHLGMRVLEREIAARLLHRILREWKSLGSNLLIRSQGDRSVNRRVVRSGLDEQQPLGVLAEQSNDSDLAAAFAHRMIVESVIKHWQQRLHMATHLEDRSWRQQSVQIAHTTLLFWSATAAQHVELGRWAERGAFYVGVATAMHKWKVAAKPLWKHSTRRAYSNSKRMARKLRYADRLEDWRLACQTTQELTQKSAAHRAHVTARRLVDSTLAEWRNDSRPVKTALVAHMWETWIREWATDYVHVDMKSHDAQLAWRHNTKARHWKIWVLTSLQLKARQYIISDLMEKNTRKSLRDVLVYWIGDSPENLGASPRSSILGSRYGVSHGGMTRNSLQPSRRGPPQSGVFSALNKRDYLEKEDEEMDNLDPQLSEIGDDVDEIIRTPTRWTGNASSVTRFPSTTPFAPLPTPFERELRGRYGGGSALSSTSTAVNSLSVAQTPRLSINDIRRRAEERRQKGLG